MYPGTKFTVGDEELIVPALSLGQLRNGVLAQIREHDSLIAGNKLFDALEYRGKIILAAIRRNYPDYDETKLFDNLDMANNTPLWLAVLGASGFSPGEATATETETTATTAGTSDQSTVAS